MWNLKGSMTLIDLPNHYFVARFELEADFLHVLTEGRIGILCLGQSRISFALPMLGSVYLGCPWCSMRNVFSRYSCCDWEPGLCGFKHPNNGSICVEIDITQSLLGSFFINGEKVYLEYEGLDTICFRCRCYGHLVDKCPQPAPTPAPADGGS
ncbi:hypothetical protein V2J09_000334 [Rumex salicifolius]